MENIKTMKRIFCVEACQKAGEEILAKGWVRTVRAHGKLIFFDLRDQSGILQAIVSPDSPAYEISKKIRPEWVLAIKGKVSERPKSMENPALATGKVELQVLEIEILNESKTLPFSVETDGYEIGEEKRMQYRYVDLRRPRMQRVFKARHEMTRFMRNFLHMEGFYEIETPIITKSTPEGARDYVVPSRLYPGKFYALPQSPQQYKQLLMVAGFEKYFQVARCFRDEDPRADRQPEFTQLDIEMSFVQREDVMDVVERMLVDLVKEQFPRKKIQEIPFPKIGYKETMEKYGTDRPDLRNDKNDPDLLSFCWVIDFPFFEKDKESHSTNAGQAEAWTFTHNPFSAPKPEFMENLMQKKNIGDILTTQYDVVLNGFEVGGGSIRNHRPEALEKVFEIMGFEKERIWKNFGHMLEALGFGAPPHGGIAPGVDRLAMLLTGEPNIREVIAFPKTGDCRDLMMDSPSELAADQLKELRLEIKIGKKPKNK